MSILTSIFHNTIGRVLPSSPKPSLRGTPRNKETAKKILGVANNSHGRRKREDSADFEDRFQIITKRLRVDEERYAPIVNGEIFESAEIEGQFAGPMATTTPYTKERALMPPPSLSPLKANTDKLTDVDVETTNSTIDLDGISHLSQRQQPVNEFSDEHSMERARRHALATSLPPNSGTWESSERDLFYHLSYRGFEPLFPENWMHDFETLPLSLYATATTAEPLIQNHKTKEFRAIRELRELLNLGKNVRDKVLASPSVKRETIIERATKKYISWALIDMGIKAQSSHKTTKKASGTKDALPVHIVVKLKGRQSTADALLELKEKLHVLASRHRQARDIYTSIEQNDTGYHTPTATEDETRVVETSDDDLPILYGILICRSILAIFTMNSQTPLPRSWHAPEHHRHNNRHQSPAASESIFGNNVNDARSTTSTEQPSQSNHDSLVDFDLQDTEMVMDRENPAPADEEEEDSASDPRFISDFDFSDARRDVWNALVVAIVAMQIRKDMLLLQKHQDRRSNPLDEVTAGIEVASVTDIMSDDDDPDL